MNHTQSQERSITQALTSIRVIDISHNHPQLFLTA
jgi:hypothetical protein